MSDPLFRKDVHSFPEQSLTNKNIGKWAKEAETRLDALDGGAAGGGAITVVQEEGSNLTNRSTLNFIGGSLTAADDAGNLRTNVTSTAYYPGGTDVAVADGGTGASTAPGALTNLGVTAAAQTVLDDATVAAMVDTLGGASSTGTGGLVRATSPTLVTPALGTPSALVLTNATGLPLSTGVAGDLPLANLTQGPSGGLSVLGITGNTITDYAPIQAGSAGEVLRRSGTTLAFGAVSLSTAAAISGTLPVGNGGTGATTLTAHGVVIGNGTSAVAITGAGSAGQVLMSNGASADPTFQGTRRWTLRWDATNVDLPSTAYATPTVLPTTLRPCLSFDPTTDESCILAGILPQEYSNSSNLRVRIIYCANTTTAADDVRFDAATEFRTPNAGSESLDTDNFDATVDSVTGTFSTTAYDGREAIITLTPATTPAVGDAFRIKITRDANESSSGATGLDSLASDCFVVGFEFYEVI